MVDKASDPFPRIVDKFMEEDYDYVISTVSGLLRSDGLQSTQDLQKASLLKSASILLMTKLDLRQYNYFLKDLISVMNKLKNSESPPLDTSFQMYMEAVIEKHAENYQACKSLLQKAKSEYTDSEYYSSVMLDYMMADLEYGHRNYNQSIPLFKALLENLREPEDLPLRAYVFKMLGNAFRIIGDIRQSEEFYNSSLQIFKELGDTDNIAALLLNIGIIHFNDGEYDLALRYTKNSLELREKLNQLGNIAACLNNIAAFYEIKGELEKAQQHYVRALEIFRSTGSPRGIAIATENIGNIHFMQNNIAEAINNLEMSLAAYEDDSDIARNLFKLIRCHIQQADENQVEAYFRQLSEIDAASTNQSIEPIKILTEALVLKSKKRAYDKIKSQELFQQIIDSKTVPYEYKLLAIVNQTELLIKELAGFQDSSLMPQIESSIGMMLEIARNEKRYTIHVEALILESKFCLVNGKFSEADEKLALAKEISVARGLERHLELVNRESEGLISEFSKWENMISNNEPIRDKLQKSRLSDFIELMSGLSV